jgi:hypothetical protein
LVGFTVGLIFPHLAQDQHARLDEDGTSALVRSLINNPWLFALTILAVNAVKIGALTIVLPSMIVPFAGIPLFAYWAYTTGVTLVPATDIGWVALIPHTLTIIIEFEAYILLAHICSARAGFAQTLPVLTIGAAGTSADFNSLFG